MLQALLHQGFGGGSLGGGTQGLASASDVSLDVVVANAERLELRVRRTDAGSGALSGVSSPPTYGYLFYDGDDISGSVCVNFPTTKVVEHCGLKVELVGCVELNAGAVNGGASRTGANSVPIGDSGKTAARVEFFSVSKTLISAGRFTKLLKPLQFSFKSNDLPHESYEGFNGRVRYLLRACMIVKSSSSSSVATSYGFAAPSANANNERFLANATINSSRALASNLGELLTDKLMNKGSKKIKREIPLIVRNYKTLKRVPPPIKIDVGIDRCLHIDLVVDQGTISLTDSIVGNVLFSVVRINLRLMHLELVVHESVGGIVEVPLQIRNIFKHHRGPACTHVRGETATPNHTNGDIIDAASSSDAPQATNRAGLSAETDEEVDATAVAAGDNLFEPDVDTELSLQRRCLTYHSHVLTSYELMFGSPAKGERIPFRMSLRGLENLTPTYFNVENVLSVRYFLNLVLLDQDDRRYFKKQEIFFYRSPTPPHPLHTIAFATSSLQ